MSKKEQRMKLKHQIEETITLELSGPEFDALYLLMMAAPVEVLENQASRVPSGDEAKNYRNAVVDELFELMQKRREFYGIES